MNERIKKLAEQAGGEFYPGFLGSPNFIKFREEDFEKFAELLAKDFLSVLEYRRKKYANLDRCMYEECYISCSAKESVLEDVIDTLKSRYEVE
jgi:hypothetical protein